MGLWDKGDMMIKQAPFYWPDARTKFYPKVMVSPESLEYQRKRNLLVPVAEGIANRIVGANSKGRGEWAGEWNLVYFKEMDRLAKEAGLI
jgi:hypothetical protein